jgi:hypothetical protein
VDFVRNRAVFQQRNDTIRSILMKNTQIVANHGLCKFWMISVSKLDIEASLCMFMCLLSFF